MSDYVLLTEAVRKARKAHRCVHCAEIIELEEEHVYTVGVNEGFIQRDRWHAECRKVCIEQFNIPEWSEW